MAEELSLGACIDSLYNKRAERLAAEKKIKVLKSEETLLKLKIRNLLMAADLEMGAGGIATCSLNTSVEPTPKDWTLIYEYIKENDAFDMIQKRLSPLAVKERWENGIIIPGVEKFDDWDISLTKRSK